MEKRMSRRVDGMLDSLTNQLGGFTIADPAPYATPSPITATPSSRSPHSQTSRAPSNIIMGRDSQEAQIIQRLTRGDFSAPQVHRIQEIAASKELDTLLLRQRQRRVRATRATKANQAGQNGNAQSISRSVSGPSTTEKAPHRKAKTHRLITEDGLDWPTMPYTDRRGKAKISPANQAFDFPSFLESMRKEYRLVGVSGETNKASIDALADIMTGVSVGAEPSEEEPSTKHRRWWKGQHPPTLTKEAAELFMANLFNTAAKVLADLDIDAKQLEQTPMRFWEHVMDHPSSSGHWFGHKYHVRKNGRAPVHHRDLFVFAILATDARLHHLKHASSRDMFKPSQPLAKAVDHFIAVLHQKMKECPAHNDILSVYFRPFKDATHSNTVPRQVVEGGIQEAMMSIEHDLMALGDRLGVPWPEIKAATAVKMEEEDEEMM